MKLRNKKDREIVEREEFVLINNVDEKNNEIKFSGQPFCGLVSMQPTITELCGKEEE